MAATGQTSMTPCDPSDVVVQGTGLLALLCDAQLDDEHCLMHEITKACSIEELAMLSQASQSLRVLCRQRLRSLHKEHLKRVHELELAFGSARRLETAIAGRVLHHYNIHTYECSRAERHREQMCHLAILDAFGSGSSSTSARC